MYLGIHFAARSDVGLVRANNQDSGFAGPHLLAVADGMGGAAGGDIASSIAIARLAALEGEAHGPDDALDELKTAISDAHAQIVQRARNDPELSGLGTTVTALLRSGSTLSMAHIGDSRAYLLRDGQIDQVTTDHSFVQHLVDTGRLSVADAENHPKRSMLLRVLGDIDADVPVDISVRETRPGDRWMLCSDGLSGVVSKDTLRKTLLEVEDPADCADALVGLALAAGAPDNVTCVIGDIVDIDAAPDGVGPPTGSQIVGSAARDRRKPSAGGDTAAGRAAKLANRDEPDDDEEPARDLWQRLRPWILPLVVLLAIAGAAWGGYVWSQQQYYVGESEGFVAIYQGIPETLGPVELHELVETSDLRLEDLAPYQRERVLDAIRVGELDEARAVVGSLETGT
ncbi:PP2C family protein-serine/threonine phosphatase [Demequina lignilytica]|uniref:Protein phosphatase 2C domain-containing protein n=1 Tax=Demequina lignilytica TaxID=3051663 RepID=A0AAW7M8B6_9MICO|nr:MULTISPECIES: protein phosphatase 2C domain-containing protein [unclassified Demequina]MDN4477771.1 protein phosphatase 2C domain-containing protein [Demequina sp. SYSU T00039-1]MDN4483411.1 protein phosphatase 2C domain-containing protein [Demequina sp. SYSU T0a273]MDN4487680.1 protein phosphatase 2C domain-containing protein [Demequina sp. SYSU T00039]MDN4491391.1 protein phosphatase 2C domain-containing protein [Demequina sp. SYSU T00068]